MNSGPRRFGLDMSSSAARRPSGNLYVVVLKKDGKHPLGPRSDEGLPEKKKQAAKGGQDAKKASDAKEGKPDADEKDTAKEDAKKPEKPSIDPLGAASDH